MAGGEVHVVTSSFGADSAAIVSSHDPLGGGRARFGMRALRSGVSAAVFGAIDSAFALRHWSFGAFAAVFGVIGAAFGLGCAALVVLAATFGVVDLT